MSPVIRIPDELFSRLQKHSVPLIDSPADVIRRILDVAEGKDGSTPTRHQTSVAAVRSESAAPYGASAAQRNFFLAPASSENLAATVQNSVPFAVAAQHLPEADLASLREALGGENAFRCWAMTDRRRTVFETMSPGDHVLFSEKGTGEFTWTGDVLTKLVNQRLGETLWRFVPGRPWKLIYVLDNVRKLSVSKPRLLEALGYLSHYRVPGIIQVRPLKVANALREHGSFEGLLEFCGERN